MTIRKLIAGLIAILPTLGFGQTPEELIANRTPTGFHAGHVAENAYWMAPAVRARLNEIASQAVARVNADPSELPTRAEVTLVNVWWTRDGMPQRSTEAARIFVSRAFAVDPGFSASHIRRWIVTPADYAALKANGFSAYGVDLLPEFPQCVASLATRFGDFEQIESLDRTKIFNWPYSASDYKAFIRWKASQVSGDQLRYQFLQDEIDLVGLAPRNAIQQEILDVLRQASDLYFQRIRRAQLLNQP
jgi:hypothetical protein